jgi:hypothetical protein
MLGDSIIFRSMICRLPYPDQESIQPDNFIIDFWSGDTLICESPVLFYIGCAALFGGIHFALFLRRVLAYFGIVTSALVASIGGRHRRHFVVT